MVYTGPTRSGAALVAAVAADSDSQRATGRRGKRSRVARKKPDAPSPKAGSQAGAKPRPSGMPAPSLMRREAGATDAAAKPSRSKPAPKTAAKPKPKSTTASRLADAARPAHARRLRRNVLVTIATAGPRRPLAMGGGMDQCCPK